MEEINHKYKIQGAMNFSDFCNPVVQMTYPAYLSSTERNKSSCLCVCQAVLIWLELKPC